MTKMPNVYVKCFLLTNKTRNFTKQDFEIFIQNLKEDGALEEHFDGFRGIVRSVKKAAHDAGMSANIINPTVKRSPNKITIKAAKDEAISFNLYVLIKPLSHLASEDHFGITSIVGTESPIEVYSDSELHRDIKYNISISESMTSFERKDIGYIEAA